MSEGLPKDAFWMVYGIGQGAPTRQHAHYEVAYAEAKRLARQHPGIAFVVMEAVTAVVKHDVATVTFRPPSVEIPF